VNILYKYKYSMLMDLFTDKVCDKILRHTSPAE
jgi:hypothetical protein